MARAGEQLAGNTNGCCRLGKMKNRRAFAGGQALDWLKDFRGRQLGSKHQHPSSRETSSVQAPEPTHEIFLEVEVWSFSGCWSLVLGVFFRYQCPRSTIAVWPQ